MAQPVRLADLLPAALAALRAPHLARVSCPPDGDASDAHARSAAEAPAPRTGLSQVLVRVDATLRRAA